MKLQTTVATGQKGESLAAEYLVKKGMKILTKNWRRKVGEIDIICEDGEELVLVEVKTKVGDGFGAPEDMISKAKLDRIRATSWYFDADNDRKRRIDIVAIVLNHFGEILRLDHYEAVG